MRVKLGIDPTGTDIHLGHSIPVQKLRAFQDAGHTAVLIIGDFTAQLAILGKSKCVASSQKQKKQLKLSKPSTSFFDFDTWKVRNYNSGGSQS